MAYDWVIPAAQAAYENKEGIAKLWADLVTRVFGRKYRIAVTGLSGIGKTDLFNRLTGSNVPVETSSNTDDKSVWRDRRRLRITTIPGQEIEARSEAITELFGGDKSAEGVLHVVGNGFVSLRDPATAEELRRKKPETATLEGFLSNRRQAELTDLKELITLVRQSSLEVGNPKWLCLAVTKVDLYAGSINETEDRYRLGGESGFRGALNNLVYDLGRYRFRWFSQPVCASLNPFVWNDITVQSEGVSEGQRNQMVADLINRIAHECGHGRTN